MPSPKFDLIIAVVLSQHKGGCIGNPLSRGSDGRAYRRLILAGGGLGAADRPQLLIDAGAEVEGADEWTQ